MHDGKFAYVPSGQGVGAGSSDFGARGSLGDLFNDGKIDVVINPIDGPPVLLQKRGYRTSITGSN